MAADSFETLREVVVRSSQAGRLRVDLALLGREKQQLLGRLGEQLAQLLDDARLEVPVALRHTYERIKELETRMKAESSRLHDNAYGAPRGYEPEAGGYGDDPSSDLEVDEHAEVAREEKKK